jgi:hypothetical protein
MENCPSSQGEKRWRRKKEKVKSSATNGAGPTEDEIRKRACEIYQEPEGDDFVELAGKVETAVRAL